jgi:hypothetical protein
LQLYLQDHTNRVRANEEKRKNKSGLSRISGYSAQGISSFNDKSYPEISIRDDQGKNSESEGLQIENLDSRVGSKKDIGSGGDNIMNTCTQSNISIVSYGISPKVELQDIKCKDNELTSEGVTKESQFKRKPNLEEPQSKSNFHFYLI